MKRWLWFLGLYVAGVAAVTAIAFLIRLMVL